MLTFGFFLLAIQHPSQSFQVSLFQFGFPFHKRWASLMYCFIFYSTSIRFLSNTHMFLVLRLKVSKAFLPNVPELEVYFSFVKAKYWGYIVQSVDFEANYPWSGHGMSPWFPPQRCWPYGSANYPLGGCPVPLRQIIGTHGHSHVLLCRGDCVCKNCHTHLSTPHFAHLKLLF